MNFFPSFSSLFKAAKIRFSLFWGDWNGSLCSSSFFRFAIAVIDSDACQVSLGEESEELAMMNIFFLLFFFWKRCGFFALSAFSTMPDSSFFEHCLIVECYKSVTLNRKIMPFQPPLCPCASFSGATNFLKKGREELWSFFISLFRGLYRLL